MNNNNVFNLLIDVVFSISPKLGGLVTKAQDLLISFRLGEEENIPQFHLKALRISSEILLVQDETGQINNLTGKYIMEMSKLKHLQRYVTNFELYYIKFERLPQGYKISTIFNSTTEEALKILETADVEM